MKNRKFIWTSVIVFAIAAVFLVPKFIVKESIYDNHYDNHIELISKDSLDRLSNQILEQLFNDRVNNKTQRDSLINNSQLSQAQIDDIQMKIRNRQVLIKDTLIYRYRDTIITRVEYNTTIKYDTVRDTIHITDTIRRTVTESRKKRKKRRKE